MLTKWRLFNFKSVRKDTELELGPLTIFSGANSSGKSTVLQSMLLVSQTLTSKVATRSILLNGPLIKLGQFDDLRSFKSEARQILIGWECVPSHENEVRELMHVKCEVSFDVEGVAAQYDLLQLQPQLFGCTLECLTADDEGIESRAYLSIGRSSSSSPEKTRSLKIENPDDATLSSLKYDVRLDEQSTRELRYELGSAEPVGCELSHFLPHSVVVRYNRSEEQARLVISLLADTPVRSGRRMQLEREKNTVIPSDIIRLLAQSLGQAAGPLFDSNPLQRTLLPSIESSPLTIGDLYARVRRLTVDQLRRIRNQVAHNEEILSQIQSAFLAEQHNMFLVSPRRLPSDLRLGREFVDSYFSASIKYLGPLRDDPKSLYPLAASFDQSDVGLRGEHTAEVYDLNKPNLFHYIPASCFSEAVINPEVTVRSLEAAVLDWLTYMGVATGIETHDRGKLGHELKILTPGTDTPHDLTHVGVGVSQVLPILVMCLLAEPDTVLIIEQPELHLHPKVQTLLGDFFLSMAMLGKQCIIETHSEYIINRLRFRAATAQADEVSRLLKIYFAEKREGASTFRPVDVNKFGAIVDWPDGFFDQSQDEAEQILLAASRKRKAARTGGNNA